MYDKIYANLDKIIGYSRTYTRAEIIGMCKEIYEKEFLTIKFSDKQIFECVKNLYQTDFKVTNKGYKFWFIGKNSYEKLKAKILKVN